ncbi:hypothetical protein J4470_01975 [Candidatus Woesearchaeota archaeon]|nr:hypothetical protein [Candidatus Woesearchaeota archaeon]
MTDRAKYDHLEKLARTLLKSGLASNSAEAMKRAREILKIKPEKEKINIESLPKIDEIKAADSKHAGELETDRSLRELLEEDAEKIYNNKNSGSRQS